MKTFHTTTDQAVAADFWRGKARKIFAVDMEAGPHNGRPTYEATSYARASSSIKALEAVKRSGVHQVKGLRYRVRLAGPAELGCVATAAPEARP